MPPEFTPTPFHQQLMRLVGREITPDDVDDVWRAAVATLRPAREGAPGFLAAGVPPKTVGTARLQVEPFGRVLPELVPLHAAHWAETEGHRSTAVPMRPDYYAFLARDTAGEQAQITARIGGALVGSLLLRFLVSEHSSTWVALEDQLFIAKAARGGRLASSMLVYAEEILAHVGVREFRASAKQSNKAGSLFLRAGFKPVAIEFVKFIEGQGDVL